MYERTVPKKWNKTKILPYKTNKPTQTKTKKQNKPNKTKSNKTKKNKQNHHQSNWAAKDNTCELIPPVSMRQGQSRGLYVVVQVIHYRKDLDSDGAPWRLSTAAGESS